MDLIVAADRKWGIGKNGGLLAHIPTDMKYFRDHTMGKTVVMGRKTLESMPGGRGLPGRTNYVLTSQRGFRLSAVSRSAASMSSGENLQNTIRTMSSS